MGGRGARREDGEPTPDLPSLGLLENQPVAERPHLALGYAEGELPGFALSLAWLADLQIRHGSCRRSRFVCKRDGGRASFDRLA